MNLRRKSVSGSVWSLGNAALRRLINFAVFPILARLLLPEDFGIIAYAGVVIAISEVFVDQGLGVAITQREDLGRRHIDAAFWMNMAAGVAIAGSIAASANWLADVLQAPRLGPILQALSVVLVINAAAVVQTALLRRDFRFKASPAPPLRRRLSEERSASWPLFAEWVCGASACSRSRRRASSSF